MILQTACFQYTKNQLIRNVPMLTMGWDYFKKASRQGKKINSRSIFPLATPQYPCAARVLAR